jgi:excisionase family DNA binding protein
MAVPLLTAEELAKVLGVTRSFVYEHAEELGGYRLGSGPRARLRFDLDEVRCRTSCSGSRESVGVDPAPTTTSRLRRRRLSGTSVELLPIRGRSEAA